jgi:alpha-tubulin suppressor-like RCC1 family protein
MNRVMTKSGMFLGALACRLLPLAIFVVSFEASAQTTTAWDWGCNMYGQLGNGSITNSDVPVATGLESATRVAGGSWHSLALTANGTSTVWAWGDNFFGQLGNGSTTTQSNVPVEVTPTWTQFAATAPTEIAAGGEHSLVLTADGKVYAWGDNSYGQLGNNDTPNNSPIPFPVLDPSLTDFFPSGSATATAISAGEWHSLAITMLNGSSTVWAWGNNTFGQLGDNTTVSKGIPQEVTTLAGVTVTAIAAGGQHSLALDSTGQVYAWGSNAYGQLGDGTTTNQLTPQLITALTGVTVVAIAAGDKHSLALDGNNQVYAWGLNSDGQLGDGSTTNRLVPVAVGGLTATAIAGGGSHSHALDNTAGSPRAWSWGSNSCGQLGNGSTTRSAIPIPVTYPDGNKANAVSAGLLHSLAIYESVSACTTTTSTLLSRTSPIVLGCPVTDAATVTNGGDCPNGDPTGTVTFYYSKDSGPWVSYGVVALAGSGSGSGTATSPSYLPSASGSYAFKAVYISSNPNHLGSSSGDADELLTVNAVPTTTTTLLSSSRIYLGSSVTDSVRISITPPVCQGPFPLATGTWVVEASQSPNFSSRTTVDTGAIENSLPFDVTTSPWTPPSRGLWFLRASFASADGNYSSSLSGNLAEILTVL